MGNAESLSFLYPELVLVFFALIALLGSVLKRKVAFPVGMLPLLGTAISTLFLGESFGSAPSLFFGLLVNDVFSIFFRQLILIITAITILISVGYKGLDKADEGEYYFFLLTIAVSMMLAVSSNNLFMIYLTVESISIVSYIVVSYLRREILSSEAGIKYFLFGALSTGIMLYGISLIYGLFGTLDLALIFELLSTGSTDQTALILALFLVLVGVGFKCSLVPFHMWTPDVYQGAPTPIAALLSVGPKAVGFALILRVFVLGLPYTAFPWISLAAVIAVLTMTIGNVMALGQNNIKRLLAYSTIAQAGYILIGLAAATPAGVNATLFYLLVYTFMNLGAFGAVILIANSIKSENIEDYSGLYKKDPVTAIILAIMLLSLAGIPPLAGFLAKFFVLAAAVEAQLTALAVAAVINTVIGLYYYVRIIKFMFFHEPRDTQEVEKSPILQMALVLMAVATVAIGIWPEPVIHWLKLLLS